MIKRHYDSYIRSLKSTLDEIDFIVVERIIKTLLDARERDKQVFIIGNGGSATTASHLACDLAKSSNSRDAETSKRLRAISLTENVARMTAISNDLTYEDIFVEQLKNYLNAGDILIAISASGNSPNIVKAVRYVKLRDGKTIALLGFGGGRVREIADISLVISSRSYGISEDFHSIMNHVITEIIQRVLRGTPQKVVFLDRDGIINVKPSEHGYVTSWEEFMFMPGITESLREISKLGFKLVVLTNQQGVGKGILSESTLNEIHGNMLQVLSSQGVQIERVFYCPHLQEDNCFCRKPKPGLFFRAQNELSLDIDFANSYFVGDSESDILAGEQVDLKTIFLGDDNTLRQGTKPTHTLKDVSEIFSVLK